MLVSFKLLPPRVRWLGAFYVCIAYLGLGLLLSMFGLKQPDAEVKEILAIVSSCLVGIGFTGALRIMNRQVA